MSPAAHTARIASAVAVCLAALLGGAGLSTASAASTWIPITETGLPGHLELKSKGVFESELSLSPGDIQRWQINASLVDPSSPLTLQVHRDGALTSRSDGLQILVQACNSEWASVATAPTCAGSTTILGPIAASNSALGAPGAFGTDMPLFPAGTIADNADKFLLISVWLPNTPAVRADETLMGLQAILGFGLNVEGGNAAVPGDPGVPGLANTGVQVAAGALTAAGALGLGLVLIFVRRRSQEQEAEQ